MAERVEDIAKGLRAVEREVAQLSASVDERFAQVDERFNQIDERFNQVDAAILEQRRYTEFAYERLDTKMDAGFARVERKLDQFIDVQMKTNELVDRRLTALEAGPRRGRRR